MPLTDAPTTSATAHGLPAMKNSRRQPSNTSTRSSMKLIAATTNFPLRLRHLIPDAAPPSEKLHTATPTTTVTPLLPTRRGLPSPTPLPDIAPSTTEAGLPLLHNSSHTHITATFFILHLPHPAPPNNPLHPLHAKKPATPSSKRSPAGDGTPPSCELRPLTWGFRHSFAARVYWRRTAPASVRFFVLLSVLLGTLYPGGLPTHTARCRCYPTLSLPRCTHPRLHLLAPYCRIPALTLRGRL